MPTKREIKNKLRTMHIDRWDAMQEWLRSRMEMGDTDQEIKLDPLFDLKAMQLNTIVACAEELGIELERVDVNTVTVTMARERMLREQAEDRLLS